jgi:hypothetical protein
VLAFTHAISANYHVLFGPIDVLIAIDASLDYKMGFGKYSQPIERHPALFIATQEPKNRHSIQVHR